MSNTNKLPDENKNNKPDHLSIIKGIKDFKSLADYYYNNFRIHLKNKEQIDILELKLKESIEDQDFELSIDIRDQLKKLRS